MKVKFVPQNVEFEIKPGESVMHLAEDNGIYVKSVCRGVPSCAECRVRIVDGETNMFQPVAAELALIGSGWFIDRRRLACQLQCIGDVTIDMSEQIAKQQGLIGGRKAKAAKAIGDRVEDETVIRESTAGGGRSRDRDEEESEATRESQGPRENRQREARPQPPRSNVVIGGSPKPAAASTSPAGPSGPQPVNPAPTATRGIQPRREGDVAPQDPPESQGGGRGGRSRRGGRGRR
jgi:ferredoxin